MATRKQTVKRRQKSAAVLSIFDAPRMTARGRRDIAAWLRRHASWLVKRGAGYTNGRFTGRYLYR